MDLRNFFQGNIQADPESRLQELLGAILVRTQFVPGVRHAIGWRGLKQESAAVEGWTARIRGWAGVFGLHFEGRKETPGWFTGSFGLSYFPDPDEDLVERCALLAAAHCQRPDYLNASGIFYCIPTDGTLWHQPPFLGRHPGPGLPVFGNGEFIDPAPG